MFETLLAAMTAPVKDELIQETIKETTKECIKHLHLMSLTEEVEFCSLLTEQAKSGRKKILEQASMVLTHCTERLNESTDPKVKEDSKPLTESITKIDKSLAELNDACLKIVARAKTCKTQEEWDQLATDAEALREKLGNKSMKHLQQIIQTSMDGSINLATEEVTVKNSILEASRKSPQETKEFLAPLGELLGKPVKTFEELFDVLKEIKTSGGPRAVEPAVDEVGEIDVMEALDELDQAKIQLPGEQLRKVVEEYVPATREERIAIIKRLQATQNPMLPVEARSGVAAIPPEGGKGTEGSKLSEAEDKTLTSLFPNKIESKK